MSTNVNKGVGRMLNAIENLELGFKSVAEKSKKTHGPEIEKIRQLTLLYPCFEKAFREQRAKMAFKYNNSLVQWSYYESQRLSAHILFLTMNALYKNAYDDIRYMIESIIQSFYLDSRHSKSTLETKLENGRDYHAQSLIGKLQLGEQSKQKEKLEGQYKKLSQIIHFGRKQILCTIGDILSPEDQGIPAKVNKNEIIGIYESLRSADDMFFFLVISSFPEIEEPLKNDAAFLDVIKKFNLPLLCNTFNVT
jgi:hypothetical protein